LQEKQNMIRSKKHEAAVVLLALGSPLGLAHADEVALPTVKVSGQSESDDIKVDRLSSPKFSQPLVDTPQTVTVIDQALMQQQGAVTLTEALRNTPGVSTFYLGENGNTSTGDSVYMRGYDASSSIYVDGVQDLGAISRDMFNIDQVEVIKGAAGTDYGVASPSGSINLVTKQANLQNSTAGSLELGHSYTRATADVNRALDGVKGGAIRINVMGQKADVPGRDSVENKRAGVAASLALGLGTPNRLWFDAMYLKQNNVPDGGVPTIGLPGYTSPDPTRPYLSTAPAVDPSNFYGTDSDYQKVTSSRYTLTLEHDFSSNTTLRNVTRWAQTQNDYLLTSFMGSAANWLTPNPDDVSTWSIARYLPTLLNQKNTILTNQTSLKTQLQTGAIKHDVLAGVEFTQSKQTNLSYATQGAWPAANLYAPDPDVTGLTWHLNGGHAEGVSNTAAIYAFDTAHLTDRWLVTGGVRLDHYRTTYDSTQACGTGRRAPVCPGGVSTGTLVNAADLSTSGNAVSWKLGTVYKLTPDSSLYVNYANAELPPGSSNFQLSSSANSANNPNYAPQKTKTVEAGAKWDALDGRLGLAAAVYHTQVLNGIVQDPVSLQYYQTGKQRVQGVELSAVGNITPDWQVNAGWTLMDTKVTSGPAVGNDPSDDQLNYTPRTAFTSWTSYRVTPKFTIGGGPRYTSMLQRGKDGAVGTPRYADSYWVVDAMASYQLTKAMSLQLNVYNLFDKEYVAAINKSGYRYTPGMPRTVRLSTTVKF
jgi:catecholate siderophore receptor